MRMADSEASWTGVLTTKLSQWSSFHLTLSILIPVLIAAITFVILLFCGAWKLKTKVLPSQIKGHRNRRFRKRDKVMFYGRKMLRKVRSFTRNTVGAYSGRGRMKKRQLVMKLAKRLLLRNKDSLPTVRIKEPPQSFLEVDWPEFQDADHRLPAEVLYMIKSVRVFGHFERPMFLELCKHIDTMIIPAGRILFKIGNNDDSIYVVRSGLIQVFITESDGCEYVMKEVGPGDSIYSLLSIVDVLTGHPSPYKTVSARALTDSTILRLPAQAFQSIFERFPESLVRVVQIIMVRLQRVTFVALHNYLGLSSELLNPHKQADTLSQMSIHSIAAPKHHRHSVPGTAKDEEDMKAGGKSMEHLAKPQHNFVEEHGVKATISDFDSACMRARVSSVDTVNFTPSFYRQMSEDSTFANASRQNPKKPPADAETISPIKIEFEDSSVSEAKVLELAAADLVTMFKLKDSSMLDGKLTLRHAKAGTELAKQGDEDASLIFVVTGTLRMVQQSVGPDAKERLLFTAHPGEIVGALAVLTGEPSFFSIKAKTDAHLVTITKGDFYQIMREQPSVVLDLSHTIVCRMSPFVRQIDFALDWMMIEAGRALFRQGDISKSVYIVLSGRLRSVITLQDGKKELVGEYGRGELVGIVEILTQTERATTVMAVRDTELAKIPGDLLNVIKRKYPQIVTRLIHLLGQKVLGNLQNRSVSLSGHNVESCPSVTNLATVAVLPVSADVPLTTFTLELQHALCGIGQTTRLTSDIIKTRLGASALDSFNEFRLFSWLGQQEDIHRMVLYQCDKTLTKWTKTCISQADCILIVGLADNDPTVSQVERQMENIAVRAQKELILLHKPNAEPPKNTVEWLNARGWCSSHHHIRCPKRIFSKKSENKALEYYEQVFQTKPDRLSDYSRLARFLTGTSVGLVLGGGGARGAAHVGMIRSLVEAGIPIDMVGGTSIGSFIGALWCEEVNLTRFTQRAREWFMDMKPLLPKIWDLTYPVSSMFTGGGFNRTIEKVFKDRQIEDLWIPYFCVTTDITSSSMRIHNSGNLWRYVRSSMSLSGYLPPLCDPVDGHLLLDGGYVNNVPGDVMRKMGAQTIFAIDVGSLDESNLTNYGDELSGWWLLWKRWNPWASPIRVPDMAEIQSRLAYVSCVQQLDIIKRSDYCEYIRPPIDKYGTLQFGSFDSIYDVGYTHGKTLFEGWLKGGLLERLFKEKSQERSYSKLSNNQPRMHAMPHFTDLAELVSKIDDPKVLHSNSDSPADSLDGAADFGDDEYLDYIEEEDDADDEVITVETNPAYNSEGSLENSSSTLLHGSRQEKSGSHKARKRFKSPKKTEVRFS